MRVKYNKENDILLILLSDKKVYESDQEKKDMIIDYDAEGKIIGIEILNASKNILSPTKMEYEIA